MVTTKANEIDIVNGNTPDVEGVEGAVVVPVVVPVVEVVVSGSLTKKSLAIL